MRRRCVSPGVSQRFEPGPFFGDRPKQIEEIARGPRQSIEPGDNQYATLREGRVRAHQLLAIRSSTQQTKSTLLEMIINREICRLTDNQARRNGFIRDDPIGFTAHDAVAFAGSFLEPRPVNFDQAPPIGSDSTNGPEFGNHLCHGRPSHSKQLRKRPLRDRHGGALGSIVQLKQPAGQASLDRVQPITGCDVLELK
jgi:hypothetical protein